MCDYSQKKLTNLSKVEQLKFFDSFDMVFTDVDGVLWDLGQQEIEGAPEGIAALRKLGKQCYFITNNSTVPLTLLVQERLKKFNVVEDEIIRPVTALKWYLKNINFEKEIYVIGTQAFKDEIKNAGFQMVTDEVAAIPDATDALIGVIKSIRPNVGAVAIDFALNVNFVMLQKCVEYITKNKALFLVTASDPIIPFGGTHLIGTFYFVKGIEEVTGQTPILLSKPGKDFNDLVVEQLGPLDPKRVLFIGDSAVTDMAFATKFGYQKLLPLTGCTTKEDLKDWKYEKTWKPDYYVDSLKDFDTVISNLAFNCSKL